MVPLAPGHSLAIQTGAVIVSSEGQASSTGTQGLLSEPTPSLVSSQGV